MGARSLLLLGLALGAPASARSSPVTWAADLQRSEVFVNVFKKGALSGFAHDHHFIALDWSATARLDPADPSRDRFEVIVAAGSLRDREAGLSAKDRDEVDARAAGPEVLDARRYPEIRFVSTSPVPVGGSTGTRDGIEGELAGRLWLHGHDHLVTVHVTASRESGAWHARGTARLKQSDFGIEPYSGFLGTIAVHDEIEVTYDLLLNPFTGKDSR